MILLTFNILESNYYNKSISREEILKNINLEIQAISIVLKIYNIQTTFFCETKLLGPLKLSLKKLVQEGHEISIFNLNSNLENLKTEKENTENFLEKQIKGIRQTKFQLDIPELKLLEFSYISNLEYSEIYFPFKKLRSESQLIEKFGISIISESVSPYSRIPYNDLLFQISPQKIYQNIIRESLKTEDFVMIYLNIFQFSNKKIFKDLPFLRRINTGKKIEDKLSNFLEWINENDMATARIKDFVF